MKFSVKALAATMIAGLLSATSAHALTIYSSVDEENASRILKAFTADTGVKVDMVFLSSGPALSRIEAEANSPQADIWFGAPSENHILAKERGLTQPLASANAGDLADNFKDSEGYWHAVYTNPLAVGVRTDILEQRGAPVPASWEDLKNEAYKGIIQMPSPQSSGTAYAVIMTLSKLWGEDKAFEYMAALNPNIQTYTQSGTAPSGALGVGETPIALQFSPGFLKLVDEGFPVKVIFPSEGVGYEVSAMSVLKGAPNVDDAKKFVDWMTSAKGQEQLAANKTYFMPIRTDVDAGKGVPKLSEINLVSYDAAYASENRQRLVDRWVDEVLSQ